EQHLGAVVAAHAFDQFLDRTRLVDLRIEIRLDDELAPAFGFFRPRRPVRHPDLAGAFAFAEFRAALAQQLFERLHRSGDAERHRLRRRTVALLALTFEDFGKLVALVGRRADQRLAWIA